MDGDCLHTMTFILLFMPMEIPMVLKEPVLHMALVATIPQDIALSGREHVWMDLLKI